VVHALHQNWTLKDVNRLRPWFDTLVESCCFLCATFDYLRINTDVHGINSKSTAENNWLVASALTNRPIDIQNTSGNDGHKKFAYECAYYSEIKLITERQFLALYLLFRVITNIIPIYGNVYIMVILTGKAFRTVDQQICFLFYFSFSAEKGCFFRFSFGRIRKVIFRLLLFFGRKRKIHFPSASD